MNSPHEIKAILTDVGGVLIKNYDGTRSDVQQRVRLADAQFDEVWKKQIDLFGRGGSEYDFWRAFADAGGKDVPDDDEVLRKPFEQNLVIYDKVLSLLGSTGYHLAALSNTIEPHSAILQRHGVYTPFNEHLFLSHEIRERKPDHTAYEFALNRMKAYYPSEILYIDDAETNLAVPRAMGMATLLATGGEDEIVASIASRLSIHS